ncbi:LETM1-like protein-domain-containing protein [Spinellus fusiger]|nr:LETM1-like protein-domain-containing protein [Spinellus fusiger]
MASSVVRRQLTLGTARWVPSIRPCYDQASGCLRVAYPSLVTANSKRIHLGNSTHFDILKTPRFFSSVAPQHHSKGHITSNAVEKPLDRVEAEAVKESGSRIVRFIKYSKDLVVFYKDGIKLLWGNRKTAKELKRKVQQEGYVLSRSEFQLIYRSEKDVLKLIPFGVVFCILPESIPLLIMFVPGVVPSTCLKESQIGYFIYLFQESEKQREKLDKLRQTMCMNVIKSSEKIQNITPEDFLSVRNFTAISKNYDFDFDLARIDKKHLASYCKFMNLSGWGTQGILKRRLDKHMDYLLEDDKLLAKEGVDTLSDSELKQAAEERGMRSINNNMDNISRGVKYWMALHTMQPPISRGMLVFSRMFLLNANYK